MNEASIRRLQASTRRSFDASGGMSVPGIGVLKHPTRFSGQEIILAFICVSAILTPQELKWLLGTYHSL
jgi:hypothetical protein